MKYLALLLIFFSAGLIACSIIYYIKMQTTKNNDDWHGGNWPYQ